jgi:hypothetical protein
VNNEPICNLCKQKFNDTKNSTFELNDRTGTFWYYNTICEQCESKIIHFIKGLIT